MYIHEKNGNYVDAEHNRLKLEQLKKDLEARTLYEMDLRQKRELNDLAKSHDHELATFHDFWNNRTDEVLKEGEKA